MIFNAPLHTGRHNLHAVHGKPVHFLLIVFSLRHLVSWCIQRTVCSDASLGKGYLQTSFGSSTSAAGGSISGFPSLELQISMVDVRKLLFPLGIY